MDGSNRTVLHNTNLVWPNGITLDLANQRIYWIDASIDTIEYSNVDGSGRTLLERVDDEIFHPFAITLENEFLFWTDWNQLAIFTTHKDLPNDNIISLYDVLVDSPHGIEAVTPDRQQNGKIMLFLHIWLICLTLACMCHSAKQAELSCYSSVCSAYVCTEHHGFAFHLRQLILS